MDMVFPAERTHFPGVHKIDAPVSGPRIADKNFTDTRIFVIGVTIVAIALLRDTCFER